MRKSHRWIWTSAVLACVLIGVGQTQADLDYQIIDLGSLSQIISRSLGSGINNQGQATGWTDTDYAQQRAFLYSNGVMQDIGDFGWGPAADTYGEAINEIGHVTGSIDGARGFLYRGPDDYEIIDSLGGYACWAEDVNDHDQVVGRSTDETHDMRAFIWENGVTTDLGTLGGQYAWATAINNSGQVVGYSDADPDDHSSAIQTYIWEDGEMRSLVPDGGYGAAWDINDAGQVVGASSVDGWPCAFRWSESEGMIALPGLGEFEDEAYAINNSGDIVGFGYASYPEINPHALLWKDDELIDLKELMEPTGWNLFEARDINDQGWIVGYGHNPEGKMRAFMLIPEPASIMLLAFGFLAMRRRRPQTALKSCHETVKNRATTEHL